MNRFNGLSQRGGCSDLRICAGQTCRQGLTLLLATAIWCFKTQGYTSTMFLRELACDTFLFGIEIFLGVM